MFLDALLIFAAYVILDIIWAKYTISLSQKCNSALVWSVLIPILSGYVVIEYVKNPWMLIPVAAGAVVGTYLGMHSERVLAALHRLWSRPTE